MTNYENTEIIGINKTKEYEQLCQYRRRIVESVNYRGHDDHEDVISILKECRRKYKTEAIRDFVYSLKNKIIDDTAYACDCTQHSGYYDYTIKIGDICEYIDVLVDEIRSENHAE